MKDRTRFDNGRTVLRRTNERGKDRVNKDLRGGERRTVGKERKWSKGRTTNSFRGVEN